MDSLIAYDHTVQSTWSAATMISDKLSTVCAAEQSISDPRDSVRACLLVAKDTNKTTDDTTSDFATLCLGVVPADICEELLKSSTRS
jgi:hypothetical protein